jgi:hypothetical protein
MPNLYLESIDLREFRGILNCEKPIELSRFAVFIGRNNTGKSSLLEALSLFPRPDYPVAQTVVGNFGRQNKASFVSILHSGMPSLVYGRSGVASVAYGFDHKQLTWKLDASGGVTSFWSNEVTNAQLQRDPIGSVARMLNVSPEEGTSPVEIIGRTIFFIPSSTSFMQTLESMSQNDAAKNFLTKTGAHVRVVKELINKCVDDNYSEIIWTPTMSLRKEKTDGSILYIPVTDVGSGIEKVAVAVLWLDALNPSVVLWDDFEGFAHPALVEQLIRWLEKKKRQIIMSTHSIDVLNKVLEVKPEGCTVIQLKKTKDDVLVHHSMSLEELEDIMDSSQDPRALADLLHL